jgi:ABC-2 type transport system ATP-binding protein
MSLQVSHLTRYYGQQKAVNDISFEINRGEIVGFLGPNGAGKSTTIGIMSSLVNKTSGHVEIFGYDFDKQPAVAKKHLGLVPQEFNFNQFEKVYDVLITQAGYYGIPATKASDSAEKYLRALGLWDKRNSQSRLLSGGMKRRLMIARALVHEPKLLILDEPTAGVDIELRRTMWTYLADLNQKGTTIILTTHYLEEAENLCRNVAIIDEGQIVCQGRMAALLQQLHVETLVLDMAAPLSATPMLEAYPCELLNGSSLHVEIKQGQGLNSLFAQLSAQGIQVTSMRNKANRLEELFVRLVSKQGK